MTVTISTNSGELELYVVKGDQDDSYVMFDPDSKEPLIEVLYKDGTSTITNKSEKIDQDDRKLSSQFDEFYFTLVENMQSGTEGGEEKIEVEDKPYDPDRIRVDTRSFSLRQIYDMINSEDLVLNPDFQRYFVWDNTRQSRLIESILLRIPLPMFYFSQDEEGKIAVVDGLQRLSSIKRFMDNELQLKKS
jgi:hypothetical protein